MRRTSTRSSATSRCPRMMRSSAASDFPMPLLPSSSTPTPSTSISTAWMLAVGASCSSRYFWIWSMATDDISGVRSSGTPSRSAASRRIAGISSPLVTTTHAGLSEKNASTEVRAASSDSVSRYEISVAPSTWTRSGCTCAHEPRQRQPWFLDALNRDPARRGPIPPPAAPDEARRFRPAATGP